MTIDIYNELIKIGTVLLILHLIYLAKHWPGIANSIISTLDKNNYDFLIEIINKFDASISWLLNRLIKNKNIYSSFCLNYIIENDKNILGAIKNNPFYKYKFRIFLWFFIIYATYSFIMTAIASPVEYVDSDLVISNYKNDKIFIYLLLLFLVITNVLTDMVSLAITMMHIVLIKQKIIEKNDLMIIKYIIYDVFFACLIFSISQIISNALYSFPLAKYPNSINWSQTFSIDTPFYPYAFIFRDTTTLNFDGFIFGDWTFPGQLFLTGTILYPTLFLLALLGMFFGVRYLVRVMQWLFEDDGNATYVGIAGRVIGIIKSPFRILRNTNNSEKCDAHFVNIGMIIIGAIITKITL